MAVSDTSPNADNLYKGAGIAYFQRTGESLYRDLGYMQLVETTPGVDKTDVYAARGGERKKIKTFVNQTNASFAVTMQEWTAKNLAIIFGGTEAAAVNLVTTGDTHTNTTLDNIASLTGLVHGRRYFVSGTGIPAGASFVFDEAHGSELDVSRAADAGNTGNGVMTLASPAFASGAKPGIWRVVCTTEAGNGGTFTIFDPDNLYIDQVDVGDAFTGDIKFTIADGATDFDAGDTILVTVASVGGDGTGQVLDRAATATGTDVTITITAPIAFGLFDASQVTGSFIFVGDNNVGPPVRIEALNCILTPNGAMTLLDSDATDRGLLAMTLDVYLDTYGKVAQFYWNDTTAWVPAA